jgi:hypothetical protein
MAANAREERRKIFDLHGKGSAFGIPDAETIRGQEGEK